MMRITHALHAVSGRMRRYVERPWYPLALGAMAALDHFVVIIPTDGLLVTSVVSSPGRWVRIVVGLTLGSTLGAVALAGAIGHWGMDFVSWLLPGIQESAAWIRTDRWVDEHGTWALFAVAALPIAQHPAIILAALAGMPLATIFGVILAGRLLKYLVIGYLATHAPKVLFRSKHFRKEVEEVRQEERIAGICPPEANLD